MQNNYLRIPASIYIAIIFHAKDQHITFLGVGRNWFLYCGRKFGQKLLYFLFVLILLLPGDC